MQDNIFASHTFLGGHVDVNSYGYKTVEMCYDLKETRNTHVTLIFKA